MKTLLLVLSLYLGVGVKPAVCAERVALVIGNNHYVHARPLDTAVNDAQAMSELLSQLGFEVVHLVDADRNKMSEGMSDFLIKAHGASAVFVFFAGHGIESTALGDNFLIPVDAKLEKEAHLDSQAYALDRLIGKIQGLSASIRLVVLDCCRNNPLEGRAWSGGRGTRGLAAVDLQRLDAATMVVFSAGPGKVAIDRLNTGDTHSPFSTVLLEQIRRPGATAISTIAAVEEAVAKITGETQRPKTFISGNLAPFSRFEFSIGGAARPSISPTPVTTEPAQEQLVDKSQMRGVWRVVEKVVSAHGGYTIVWNYTARTVGAGVEFIGKKVKVNGAEPTRGEKVAVSQMSIQLKGLRGSGVIEEVNFRGERLVSSIDVEIDSSLRSFSAINKVGAEVVSNLTGSKQD